MNDLDLHERDNCEEIMDINDDENQKKYLDFSDFCLIDIVFETDSFGCRLTKNNLSFNEKLMLKNKYSVDFRILEDYKYDFNELYNTIRENLLLLQIEEINKYTSHIPLDQFYKNMIYSNEIRKEKINSKKKLLVDVNTLTKLNQKKELNWISDFNRLYPIWTIGDGNCLCHAVLSYMVGMQDINLELRGALKLFMNSAEDGEKLKARWLVHRKRNDANHNIETNENQLETEWIEIKNMITHQQALLTKENQEQTKNMNTSSQSNSSLVFLEDIHIFALANLLRRTIIVISQETIQNLQPNYLRGIYMPLLINSEKCVKDPIVILYQNSHFMPLLLAQDDDSLYKLEFERDKKWHDFENDNEVRSVNNKPTQNMLKIQAKQNNSTAFNLLPLIYSNLEPMLMHFLHKDEEKKACYLLTEYLNTIEKKLPSNDSEIQPISILCCYLNKKSKHLPKDGIETYLKYLDETITQFEDNSYFEIKNEPLLNKNTKFCKSSNCTNSTQSVLFDYCDECFKIKQLNENTKNLNTIKQLSDRTATKNNIESITNDKRIETLTNSSKIFSSHSSNRNSNSAFSYESRNKENNHVSSYTSQQDEFISNPISKEKESSAKPKYCLDCRERPSLVNSCFCENCEPINSPNAKNTNNFHSELRNGNKIKSSTNSIEIPIKFDRRLTEYENKNTITSYKNLNGDSYMGSLSNRLYENDQNFSLTNPKPLGTLESNNRKYISAYDHQRSDHSRKQYRVIKCNICKKLEYTSDEDFCLECRRNMVTNSRSSNRRFLFD